MFRNTSVVSQIGGNEFAISDQKSLMRLWRQINMNMLVRHLIFLAIVALVVSSAILDVVSDLG